MISFRWQGLDKFKLPLLIPILCMVMDLSWREIEERCSRMKVNHHKKGDQPSESRGCSDHSAWF
jgi:hypothetical protein